MHNFRELVYIAILSLIISGCYYKSESHSSQNLSEANEAPTNVSEWLITNDNMADIRYPSLANGNISAVVPSAGGSFDVKTNHFMSHVWSESKGKETFAKIPRWTGVSFHDGKEDLEFTKGSISAFQQRLNMRIGTLESSYVWQKGARKAKIETRMFISSVDENLAVIQYRITPSFDGQLAIKRGIDGSDYGHLDELENGSSGDSVWLSTRFEGTNTEVGIVMSSVLDGASADITAQHSDRKSIQISSFDAERGKSYTLTSFVSIYNNLNHENPLKKAKEKLIDAKEQGFESLYNSHVKQWNERWQTDLIIEGTNDDIDFHQKFIRSIIYTFLQSTQQDGSCPTNPMGFTSAGWAGHVFWDTEIWMFPGFLALHPEMASCMLRYRAETLSGAIENAKKSGHDGAEISWRSGFSGKEGARAPYSNQEHVSSDVVFTFWQHYLYTGDKDFLRNYGKTLIQEVARYIKSRVIYKNGRYEVHGVMTADEYSSNVNNSAYTNSGFKRALEIATKVSLLFGEAPDPMWAEIAEGMYVPFDEANQRFIEYDGYNGKVTKQADTELLIYPLEVPMTETVKENTLNYYSKRINKSGPAMSRAIYSIVYSSLKNKDKAYEEYLNSYQPYLKGPFYNFSETPKGNGGSSDFITGKGGTLQTVINGFVGMRIREDGVYLNPSLPKGWTSITLRRVRIGQGIYDIIVREGDFFELRLLDGYQNIAVY